MSAGREGRPDPWLDASSLELARRLGLSPREYVDRAFASERETLQREVRQLRLVAQERRQQLRALELERASDDAIATAAANVEHTLGQIAGLLARYGELERRHASAVETLASGAPLEASEAVAEAERVLREEGD